MKRINQIKSKRPLVQLSVLLLGMLAAVGWCYSIMADARRAAEDAAESFAACQQLELRLGDLRRRPSLAGTAKLQKEQMMARVHRAAAAAQMDANKSIQGIHPVEARRIGTTVYLEQPTEFSVHHLPMRQLVAFLHALENDGSGLRVSRLHFTAPRDEGLATGSIWDADATVTYLIYAPVAESATPG